MFLFHKIITWGYYNHFISYKSCASYYHLLEVISRTLGRSHANTVKLIKTIIILELQCEKNKIWKVLSLKQGNVASVILYQAFFTKVR